MAKKSASKVATRTKKTTSIGNSSLSRPKNKSKKRSWKPYIGQGK